MTKGFLFSVLLTVVGTASAQAAVCDMQSWSTTFCFRDIHGTGRIVCKCSQQGCDGYYGQAAKFLNFMNVNYKASCTETHIDPRLAFRGESDWIYLSTLVPRPSLSGAQKEAYRVPVAGEVYYGVPLKKGAVPVGGPKLPALPSKLRDLK